MGLKRVAIIGGGVAGLAAGIRLLRQGCDVSIYEARDELGGCCSTTHVDGFTFNNGAMFVAVPRLLDHAFARLRLDRASLVPMRRIGAPQASFLPDGNSIIFGDGGDVRIEGEHAATRTATLQAEIDRSLSRWAPLLRIFTDDLLTQPLSVPRVLGKAWRHLHKLRGNLATELQRSFSDPDARAAIAAVTLYTGLAPERTPVFQIVGFISMLQDGLHLPENGMGAISDALHRSFRELGGKVHVGTRVDRIRIVDGKVRGLVIDDDEVVADAVVSTASGMATFSGLMDPADVPASMQRRVSQAPLSHRALGVQLGLRNTLQTPAHSVNHVPLLEQQHRMLAPQPADSPWLTYTVPTHTLPGLAAAGGSIVEMFAPVDQDLPLAAWDTAAKEAAADAAIAALARYQPLDIAVRRVTSPKDYAERMHLFQGALYGLSPAAGPGQQFLHETPLKGLFLAGQTTYPGFGVATSAFSGIFAADAVIARMSGG
ncbi:phytoene desaturase [Luteimonas cucumeris]|uniref:Phytoene desaturase n=1 Tax=Luteimonas cucumeris TaxID=985012 RepID=A0A562LAA0_9GAMM|nr:NAD(P)/FAD-dependent oxidoreductase [Luteimonas cucumeris]TWI04602.1 phytoene desaturase [Luteimonas cucumeris]